MQINPFNIPLTEMEAAKADAVLRIADLSRLLDWYLGFVPEAANARRMSLERSLAGRAQHLASLQDRLRHLQDAKKAAEKQAAPGFDPRTLFSSERAVAKRKVAVLSEQIAQIETQIRTLAPATTESGEDLQLVATSLSRDLDNYRQFDVLKARSEIAIRQHELLQSEPELVRLRERKLRLDRELAGPWQSLQARRARCATIERDLRKAEQFSAQLGAASGNKAAIHQACERELGDASPGRVKSDRKRKLDFEMREVIKLEQRIAEIVKKCQLDVREVIIDGSNMAYHAGVFIGLKALEAILPKLTPKYGVTINFDPGFGRKLGLSSREIRARFPDALVHFVPRGMKADPFVLAYVEDKPHAYVISNDNFRDFGEKQAVQQGRILKHAVLNDMACIPALDIEAPLAEPERCD